MSGRQEKGSVKFLQILLLKTEKRTVDVILVLSSKKDTYFSEICCNCVGCVFLSDSSRISVSSAFSPLSPVSTGSR